ncbi:MAG: hypothetical protein GX359_03345 [Clostridiales bacterium]|nr:hypothetical protein [Clostridiales bacterium]
MFRKGSKSNKSSSKSLTKKMNSISYDEHFTRATDSIDLMKSTRLADIGDGITPRKESEYERYTK